MELWVPRPLGGNYWDLLISLEDNPEVPRVRPAKTHNCGRVNTIPGVSMDTISQTSPPGTVYAFFTKSYSSFILFSPANNLLHYQ